jgi:hypothetical protein
MHKLAGFVLKNEKQACGPLHEFLQRQCAPDSAPTRPFWATLAQLASGNWYTDVHIWYDAAVQAVSDNIWELHTRGLPIAYARRLAKIILDATMRVPLGKDEENGRVEWKELEWWSYRHGSGESPLWHGTSGERRETPAIDAKPLVPPNYPAAATDAYIDARRSKVRLTPDKWQRYKQLRLKEAYSKWNTYARARAHTTFAQHVWPERAQLPDIMGGVGRYPREIQMSRLRSEVGAVMGAKRPVVIEDVLNRLDIDPNLLSLAGGWEVFLSYLPREKLAEYENPDIPRAPQPGWWWLDNALKAVLTSARGIPYTTAPMDNARLELIPATAGVGLAGRAQAGKRAMASSRKLHLILAPNGAGKTTFVQQHPNYADLDEVVVKTGAYNTYRRFGRHSNAMLQPRVARNAIWRAVADPGMAGLVAQYNPAQLVPPPEEREWGVMITIVEPERSKLMERLRDRQWGEEKIAKRLARWESLLSQIKACKTLTSQERAAIKYTNTWEGI